MVRGGKRDAADGAVDSWVEAVAASQAGGAHSFTRDHVRYTIDVREYFYVPRFELAAYVVPVTRGGEHGAAKRLELSSVAGGSAKHIAPADRTIGRLAAAGGLLGGLNAVSPQILATLLELLIRSSRAHWRSLKEPPLVYEPVDDASVAWRFDADGRQRLHVADRERSVLLASIPLWYVDPERSAAGPVQTQIPPEIAASLASAPSLTDEQARRAHVALRHIFSSAHIEGPQIATDLKVVERSPTPVLFLRQAATAPIAELQFAYGEHVVAPDDDTREFRTVQNGAVYTWPRRFMFEKQALSRLHQAGFSAPGHATGLLRLADDDERRWIEFIGATVPQLRAEGWRVEIDDEFPYVILDTEDEWHAELTETEARWFELELGIEVGGDRVPLLPVLIDALTHYGVRSGDDLTQLAARSEPIFGRLPSGAYVALPAARVARALATLVDLFDGSERLTEEGRLPIAPLHAAALSTLDGNLRVQWKQAEWLHRLFEDLSHVESRDVQLPPEFKAELRPYQRHGVAWLQALCAHGFGGVLADDMGLGKTVQFLAHAAIEKTAGRLRAPILIVAPTSVLPNWRAEIARFVPSLRVIALTGSDRAKDFAKIVDADVVLTTYALLPKDAEHLLDRPWSIAVLDEAQVVKNPRTKAALVAFQLRAKQCIALTGTPIENHLEDLWSIYAFAVPGLLGDRTQFARVFRTPIEKHDDVLRRSALAARLRPFLLRRTKEVVARDLPPKTEIVQRVELTGAQRDLYETIRLAMHKRVRDEVARRGLARSRILLLDALLKLRQVCCDPRLLKLPAAEGVKESQKLDALLEMLESLIDDGRRILLFSQFTSMLDLMKPELTNRKYAFVELRGDTRDRETPVKRFQSGDVPLFLISLKAGGTGLNLTAADTVIHYDPWWNPAVERQATDRAHRIGQEQHVFVYKLIAEGTVEERILELQERKGALASGLFDETSAAPLRLEFEDIERLFM